MYIAKIPNRGSPPAILLRQSYRDGKKVKTITLANLSHLSEQRIEALRRALRGEFDFFLGSTEPESGKVFGLLHCLKGLSSRIGIIRALGGKRLGKLSLFLVLARVAAQGSRLSAVRWAKNQAVAEVLGLEKFDEDDLYEALDWLSERQERIEDKLYQEYRKCRGKAPVLVLYDVTSSYFEGQHNELAAFGYNRDGKRGKKQIVIGLLTDGEGEPLSIRVFEGNTADHQTLMEQVEAVKQRFGIMEVVFVGDGGMIKHKGKEKLSATGFRYITTLTNPQIRKLLKRKVLQLELFDETLQEVEAEGKRYILRCNPLVKKKEQHRCDDKLKKLHALVKERNDFVTRSPRANPEKGLKNLNKWLERYKLSSFVRLSLNAGMVVVAIDTEAQEKAQILDGCYVIETDVSAQHLNTTAVHQRYFDLQKVERDFRTIKTTLLEIRPIFLHKASRTRGHVFVTMLALKLVREIERCLKTINHDLVESAIFTVDDALAHLSRLCLLVYKTANCQFFQLPTPDQYQQAILDALQIVLPSTYSSANLCRQEQIQPQSAIQ